MAEKQTKALYLSYDGNRMLVKRIVNSADYLPGEEVTMDDVTNLLENPDWDVVLEHIYLDSR